MSALIEKYFSEYAFYPLENGDTLLLTKTPYIPYADPGKEYFLIDAYYPAANEAYNKTLSLINDLKAAGITASRYLQYGVKELAVKSGLAQTIRLNTLAYDGTAGSRFCLSAIQMTNDKGQTTNNAVTSQFSILNSQLKADAPHSALHAPHASIACASCERCFLACPANAITENGFDRTKCLRQYMADGAYPDAETARAAGRRLWGCDACQSCCPANPGKTIPMPEELKAALKIDGFIENISARVRALAPFIGKNYAKKEKLARLCNSDSGIH